MEEELRGMPLESYLAQVWLAARHSRWSKDEAAIHLALALEGPAAQVLFDLAPMDQTGLEGLITVLGRCFGQRQSADEAREPLASHYRLPPVQPSRPRGPCPACLPACAVPRTLRQHVRLAAALSLDDALQEAISVSRATPQRGPSARPHVKRQAKSWVWGWGGWGARPPGATLRSPHPAMTNADSHSLPSL